MDATIVVEGLERAFDAPARKKFKAVDGVSIAVGEGEIYGFLGPNGAGKTTLVRMLVTLLRPTGGHARVAGHDIVKEAAAVRASIGVALQEAALDPLMTGEELLILQAMLHGMKKDEGRRRAAELLERVGLTDARDARVGTYSGGMRRRLDLALALIHNPRVLFLDEPTTGLDPVSRVALWEEVRRLNGDGTTVFLTTQYLEEADQLADRVGIIAKGKMVAEDTPAELKREIGTPTLEVCVHDDQRDQAERVLEAIGKFIPPTGKSTFAVKLNPGNEQLAPAVVALDKAGVTIESIELVEPSLDDVFVAKTGKHLEGSEVDDHAVEDGAEAAAGATR